MATLFSDIVDRVHELDVESKQELIRMIQAWLADERRQEIACNAGVARAAYARGGLKRGTVDDLMADLYAED